MMRWAVNIHNPREGYYEQYHWPAEDSELAVAEVAAHIGYSSDLALRRTIGVGMSRRVVRGSSFCYMLDGRQVFGWPCEYSRGPVVR